MQIKKIVLISASIALFGITTSILADTCPTDLKKNEKGFWFSDQKPGWRSHMALPKGVTLEGKSFGGVVFSPKRQRLACVYRASNKKWVALVSDRYADISINKAAKDDSGQGPAWKFSGKHKDYACGKPSVNDVSKCTFTFKKSN